VSRTRVFLNQDCVERLKKEGSEHIALPSGDEIEFVWTKEEGIPLPKPTQDGPLRTHHHGQGCFVETTE
jgi:hypothetical protein